MARIWLRRRREKRNLRQEDVAIKVGISRTYYNEIERGKKEPDVDVSKRIGESLDFPWEWLHDESKIPPEEWED